MMPGRCVMNMQSVKHIYTPGLCTFVYNRTICESRIRSKFHYLKNVRGMCLAVSLYPKTKLIFPHVRHKILVIPCQSYSCLVLQPRRKINSFASGWLYIYTDYKKKIVLDTINSYTLCTKHLSTVANFQPVTPLFIQAKKYPDRIAVIDKSGTHTYDKINTSSDLLANTIVQKLKSAYPNGVEGDAKTVSFLCGNDVSYVVAQWAIWKSSCVCVPLCASHPVSEIEYFVNDSSSKLLIYTEEFHKKLQPFIENCDIQTIVLTEDDVNSQDLKDKDLKHELSCRFNFLSQMCLKNKWKDMQAMMIYTSGTTGKPKGVVHTFGSLDAQMQGMIEAWGWTSSDVILHTLPLHHVHGIVNVLMTPLWVGAICVMQPKFDPQEVWSMLTRPTLPGSPRPVTIFMAVPTIYAKLIEHLDEWLDFGGGEKDAPITRNFIRAVCQNNVRLMVSGSAALPEPIMTRWEEITGHHLLERYGMTEIGMALTNPLNGPRLPGTVGTPFPSVEVCIAKANKFATNGYDVIATGHSKGTQVTKGCEDDQGELYIKGPSLFEQYWGKPEATQEAFTTDGWFKTGDTVSFKDGVYKIEGRTSVDIIKSGGFKISALDIERNLLAHPDITDVAVVGIPDITWGQKVACVITVRKMDGRGVNLSLQQLKDYCKDRMPTYHVPSVMKIVDVMPRNVMGKVNKKELLSDLFRREMKAIY